ncbi:MAG: macro domain-containing protein [Nitrospira sp.]|nr:macro domain-containing protein [Nitrospira sp.]MCK6499514.1 macro domain-containing protein [Nitrospira sp.]MEB2339274.1 macro domain-containing protein [Nitrospirales bacterium]
MSLLIFVVRGSILEAEADVIVNAANSHGIMGGGVAGVIRRAAGQEVEDQARAQAPIPVGRAVLTSAGQTKFKGVIHAPTMPEPGLRVPAQNVALATRAALLLADENAFASVAIPGMGTGVGGVTPQDAAVKMVQEVRMFVPQALRSVILVDVDQFMVDAWRKQLSAEGSG